MYTINRQVACKPFGEISNRLTTSSGFTRIKQQVSLSKTEVLFDFNSEYLKLKPGDKVYIRGEHVKIHEWAQKPFLNEETNTEFILIPADQIICIEPKI